MSQEIEYRLYSFTNYYLSSLQKGLQTAHLVEELNLKYTLAGVNAWRSMSNNFKATHNVLQNWGKYNKTIIILNGGNSARLLDIYKFFLEYDASLSLPFAKFNEDEQSLNNALTCVGIVVPMTIVDYYSQTSYSNGYLPPEEKLHQLIKGCGLAN